MAIGINIAEIISTPLDTSEVILPDRRVAIGKISGERYIIIGDGVTEAKDLKRIIVSMDKLVQTVGTQTISGTKTFLNRPADSSARPLISGALSGDVLYVYMN